MKLGNPDASVVFFSPFKNAGSYFLVVLVSLPLAQGVLATSYVQYALCLSIRIASFYIPHFSLRMLIVCIFAKAVNHILLYNILFS